MNRRHVRVSVRNAGLKKASASMVAECGTTCCHASSDKHRAAELQGVAREAFRTLGSAPIYGESPVTAKTACCAAT